jgi:predicted nucleic-acid-binding protein
VRAADTNVLVRLIVQDDAEQVAAARAFVAAGAWTSLLVLAETAWTLDRAYGLSAAQIAAAVTRLLANPSLVVQDADVAAAALVTFLSSPKVSYPDHLILEIARKAGHLPLGTFDRDFGKLAGAERI